MSLLALLLGWVLARTIRIVPASSDEPFGPGGRPPPPPPPPGPTPRRGPSTSRRPTGPTVPANVPVPATSAPPWPQVMPTGLSPFPSGWEPYEPPPGTVVQRANELLPQLWRGGAGTFKVEKTAGVWVYYRATPMGEKRGVVAFRERVPSSAPAPSPGAITVVPLGPASPTSPASTQSVSLPTLRRGSSGPEVKILQQRLGIPADGKFGPGTEAAVRGHQGRSGLTPDGVVGTRTWASLMARAA